MSNVLRLDDYREKIAQEKPIKEVKKVSIDDGYTAIPNELLESILKSGVLGWKGSYLLATVLKTLKWHKKSDWFSHSQVCEMMGIEANKYHINQLSAARSELIKAKILFEKGRNTGVNLAVFEWSMIIPDKVGKSRKSRDLIPENVGNAYPENVGNTKETLTKEKINITPLPPKGESANADGERNAKEDLSPKNKKNRSAEKIDYQGVIDAFNEANTENGSRLPFVRELTDKRKTKIKKFLLSLKKPTTECAINYFNVMFSMLRPFHFGEEKNSTWKANFDWAIRGETVIKVREENL
ncbi:replication protein [Pasteurella multocida]|uniref:replication protein n=1 Tax=Pasteurella multocida TaxID=747 RepID=UPI002CF54C97|nr:replication protein [Pasteurella multocida]MEB3492837.1 replication protein [Pasteurella multocida]